MRTNAGVSADELHARHGQQQQQQQREAAAALERLQQPAAGPPPFRPPPPGAGEEASVAAQRRHTSAQLAHSRMQEQLNAARAGARGDDGVLADPVMLVIHPTGKVASLSRASNGSNRLYSSIAVTSIIDAGANWRDSRPRDAAGRGDGGGGAGAGDLDGSAVTVYDAGGAKADDGVVRALERERDGGRYLEGREALLYEELFSGLAEITGRPPEGIGGPDPTRPRGEPIDDGSVRSRHGRDVRPGLGSVAAGAREGDAFDEFRQRMGAMGAYRGRADAR